MKKMRKPLQDIVLRWFSCSFSIFNSKLHFVGHPKIVLTKKSHFLLFSPQNNNFQQILMLKMDDSWKLRRFLFFKISGLKPTLNLTFAKFFRPPSVLCTSIVTYPKKVVCTLGRLSCSINRVASPIRNKPNMNIMYNSSIISAKGFKTNSADTRVCMALAKFM